MLDRAHFVVGRLTGSNVDAWAKWTVKFRIARQNEAAYAADAAAYIGATVSLLERRRAGEYHHRRESEEQYIDEHQ